MDLQIFFDGWCFGAIKYFKTFLQLGTWKCHMRQHLHTTLLWWCHREGFHESSPMNIKCPNNHHNTINTSFFPSLDFSTTECTIFRLVCRLSPKLNCHCLPRHHQDHWGHGGVNWPVYFALWRTNKFFEATHKPWNVRGEIIGSGFMENTIANDLWLEC